MKKKIKTFIKEMLPYILTGALASSVAFNVKLIKEKNTKDITSMPYSHKIEGSKDGIIRDTRPKLNKGQIQDEIQEF